MGVGLVLELDGATVLVAGLGVSGRAAAGVLVARGARVITFDEHAGDADVGDSDQVGPVDLVVTSPGLAPTHAVLAGASARGVPVVSEVELAWWLRADRPGGPAPWLAVTGTNGKTTTVGMLTSILAAAGRRVAQVGNVGTPVVLTATDPEVEVLAVELSSFQLHFTSTMAVQAGAVLNVAPDHLDWHGSLDAYAADKGRIYAGAQRACVFNLADPRTQQLVREADVADGCRAVAFTLGAPALGQLGLVEDVLVDRGFGDRRATHGVELATLADLAALARPDGVVPPHVVEDALAAAALGLAHGVSAQDVRAGLRAFAPGQHRIATVARIGQVDFVDDSKATNAHAAAASLASFAAGSVVWVAGGLAKGARFDDLVRARADRLAAAVLIGVDREPLRDALARHAPQVPVIEVSADDTGTVMSRAVAAAHQLATDLAPRSGGLTVLLAPACASMDQFVSYAERGEQFAAAARALADPS